MTTINAQQARSLAHKKNNVSDTPDISNELLSIEAAARMGKMNYTFVYEFSFPVIKALKDLGYNIYILEGSNRVRNSNWIFNRYDNIPYAHTVVDWRTKEEYEYAWKQGCL